MRKEKNDHFPDVRKTLLPPIERGIIQTFTGKMFNVFEPDMNIICIEDIAHALSNMCRWGGHTRQFYSVAEHSIRVALELDSRQIQIAALLHDAAEAYLVDMPRPFKKYITGYEMIENRVMEAIARKFKFQYPLPKKVKEMDDYLLELEYSEQIMQNSPVERQCLTPKVAEFQFLKFYNNLK